MDEASGLVTDNPQDEVFFDHNGAISPTLREVGLFLQARDAARDTTLKLCRRMQDLGLFTPIETHEGITLPADSLRIPSERLDQLASEEKLELAETGALLLIHAHQVSLSHCTWLLRAQQQIARSGEQGKYTKNSEISGFLSAMANAQSDDISGIERV